jgi:CubicO group peptidase (beta-lactamase class C family)
MLLQAALLALGAGLPPQIPSRQIDDAVGRYMSERSIPGMALAVMWDGQLVYSKGFGVANRETGAPFTPATACRGGSVSKGLTAVGIATLVEDGKLKLDDKVVPLIDAGIARKAEIVVSRVRPAHRDPHPETA